MNEHITPEIKKVQQELLSRLDPNIDLSKIRIVIVPILLSCNPDNSADECHDRLCMGLKGHACDETLLVLQTGGTVENPTCDKMLNYIKSERSAKQKWASRFLSVPLGRSTSCEVANALLIVEVLSMKYLKNGINILNSNLKIIFCSNKAHIPVVTDYVRHYDTYLLLDVRYQHTIHRFNLKTMLMEIIHLKYTQLIDLIIRFKNPLQKQRKKFFRRFVKF